MQYTLPTPILYAIFPFLLLGFILNGFFIWLFTKKDIPIDKSYWMALVSYAVVGLLGIFFSFKDSVNYNFIIFLIFYLLSVVIQWFYLVVYFQKYSYSWFRSLIISLVSNTLTYAIAVYYLFYNTGILTKYAELVRIQIQNIKL